MELAKQEHVLNVNSTPEKKEVEFNQEVILAQVFRKSKKEGFELMFRYYYAPLCSNAIRILYDKEAAEDLVSDIFVDFWENRCPTKITTSYKAYLYQAVRNKALNYLRNQVAKDYMTSSISEEVLNKGWQITPEDIISFHELNRNLEKAIADLPKQSRRAFQLHRLDGKKYTEIAEELKITTSAVERLISRALKKLRDTIDTEFGMLVVLTFYFF